MSIKELPISGLQKLGYTHIIWLDITILCERDVHWLETFNGLQFSTKSNNYSNKH